MNHTGLGVVVGYVETKLRLRPRPGRGSVPHVCRHRPVREVMTTSQGGWECRSRPSWVAPSRCKPRRTFGDVSDPDPSDHESLPGWWTSRFVLGVVPYTKSLSYLLWCPCVHYSWQLVRPRVRRRVSTTRRPLSRLLPPGLYRVSRPQSSDSSPSPLSPLGLPLVVSEY